jgi:hypothetical protein
LPKGRVSISLKFPPDRTKEERGVFQLLVNGLVAGEGKMVPTGFRHGLEPFEVGHDTGTPADPAYKSKGEFPFTGTIQKISFTIRS